MLNTESLNSIGRYQADAIIAANHTEAVEKGIIALPNDFKVHDLEDHLPQRRRQRGTFTTSSIDSFCKYVEAHAETGTTVFVADTLKATAVLNLGTTEQPGHADNQAHLALTKTAAYNALLHIDGRQQSQRDAAEFFEDWREHLQFFQEEQGLTISQAIGAVRNITIDAARKLESTTANLSESQSAFEQVTVSSKETIPSLIYFKCKPYEDLEERTFVLRVSILTGGEKPAVVLRIQRLQVHVEEMAVELAQDIHDQLTSTQIAVVRGTYAKA